MITIAEMKQLEKEAIDNGTTILELMERAGKGAFAVIEERFDLADKHLIIFAGHGNNGGDSFVLARYAQEAGIQTVVLFCGLEEKLSDEAKVNYDKIKETVPIVQINTPEEFELFSFQKGAELILVDALLGTGIRGSIREPIKTAIKYFNKTEGSKVSLDIPTGINPDTGKREEFFCQSELIISFHDIKSGLESLKEKTVVVDIGLGKDEIKISKV